MPGSEAILVAAGTKSYFDDDESDANIAVIK